MYLLPIHIPVYLSGKQKLIDIAWQRDVLLARDWLAPSFGGLALLCPSLPLEANRREAMQLAPIGEDDGVRVTPSFDPRCRTRHFWIRQRKQWMSDLRRELRDADVVHCSASGVFQPLWYLSFKAAVKLGIPTVLVGPDMDPHLTHENNLKGRLVCSVFDRLMKR